MIISRHDNNSDEKNHISPSHFFLNDKEKTKINWFLFEFALGFGHFLAKEKRLTELLYQKGIDDLRLKNFCIYYAKHIKKVILDKLEGRVANVRLGHEAIEEFFPDIGDRLVDKLLTIAAKAWDSQTEACVVCPMRCISERNERASMFDDPYYYRE